MWYLTYILAFITGLVLSVCLTRFSMKIACKFDVLDMPSSRKVHREPTPLLGGLGIYSALLITVFAGIALIKGGIVPGFLQGYVSGISEISTRLIKILAGGAIVVFFGVVDDARGLKPLEKLALQILVALIVFSSGLKVSLFLANPFFPFILTLAWLVLMMNIFNLMDNMDGLSAGVAFVSGFILFIFAAQMEQLFIATILAAFLGTLLGFLRYNFPPARVFMGESGSSFIGYFLGVSSMLLTYYRYEHTRFFLPFFIPLIVFAVPLFDTISVILIRKRRRLGIFNADKNHISHRLVELGMSKKQSVFFIYLLTLCTGMSALILRELNIRGALVALIQVAIILIIVGVLDFTGRSPNDGSNSCS